MGSDNVKLQALMPSNEDVLCQSIAANLTLAAGAAQAIAVSFEAAKKRGALATWRPPSELVALNDTAWREMRLAILARRELRDQEGVSSE